MDDYLLREIDKIGKVIEAVMSRLRLVKSQTDAAAVETVRCELAESLNLDFCRLLASDDPARELVERYGFEIRNLEQLAELLDRMATTASEECAPLHRTAQLIYQYMENENASFVFARYYRNPTPIDADTFHRRKARPNGI